MFWLHTEQNHGAVAVFVRDLTMKLMALNMPIIPHLHENVVFFTEKSLDMRSS